jgi:hypothetical protein
MWLSLLKNHWRKFLAVFFVLAVGLSSFIAGRNSFRAEQKEVSTESNTTKTVTKKKTTIVKNPDGTTTTTTEEDSETNSNTTKTSPKVKKDKYRVGVTASRKASEAFRDPMAKPDLGISAGYRVFSSVWLDAGYNFGTKDIMIGASVQF